MGDDEDEVKPESGDTERKGPGLREKGSVLVEEAIGRILASQSLDGAELDEEQRIKKVISISTSTSTDPLLRRES